jgi:hypothetical protein
MINANCVRDGSGNPTARHERGIVTDSPALAQRPNKNHEMQISSFSIREFAAQKKIRESVAN